MPYRLLKQGEEIKKGDQPLEDDCEGWGELAGWEVGMKYNAVTLKPIRRFELAGTPRAFAHRVVEIR